VAAVRGATGAEVLIQAWMLLDKRGRLSLCCLCIILRKMGGVLSYAAAVRSFRDVVAAVFRGAGLGGALSLPGGGRAKFSACPEAENFV
jgi:hypothetical protein